MPWVRFDDRFLLNPKIAQAGLHARALYVAGIFYCAGELTDGFIASPLVRKVAVLADLTETERAVMRLVELGLWEEAIGGYQVHDYHEYQPSAAKVKAEREANRQKQANFRASRRNPVTNGVTNAVSTSGSNRLPVPDPVTSNSTLEEGGSGGKPPPAKEPPPTPLERSQLAILRRVNGYPFALADDLEMIRKLAKEYPKVDLTLALDDWQAAKTTNAITKKDNPRLAFRNWVRRRAGWAQSNRNGSSEPEYMTADEYARLNWGKA